MIPPSLAEPRSAPLPTSSSVQRFGLWMWVRFVVFAAMHVLVLVGALTTSLTPQLLLLFAASYLIRMFGISAGYHRYFSHRSFQTSRPFQLALAILAQSANQNGVLWWAAHHRRHHQHSDTPDDVHSPSHYGFLQSHLTWFMYSRAWAVDEKRVRDWMRFPELVFLQRFPWLPTLVLGTTLFTLLDWPGVMWGYFVPTVLLLHATFSVNSLTHMFGARRYDTTDESRNNAFLGIVTLGEGWHNNHHNRPASARLGERWYELDLTWWGLCLLEKLGLIWDVRTSQSADQ